MTSLSRDARKALEKACVKARNVAEAAADKALRGLAVGEREKHGGMTPDQENLRNRLRAHGRQLGDKRDVEKGTQEIDHLVSECAYEHWHRMLFARFLAENELLIEPESGVAITIDEVRELARDRRMDWIALAGEFAVTMLPQVFCTDDPVLEVHLAPEDRKQLEGLLQSLSDEVFLASDSLGWCYQFWQAEKKDAVNKAGNKIGAEELPAVTQLFTEDYMVDFLLDNTLGAWHAGKVLAANTKLATTTQTEEKLRAAIALPGCAWNYLRFIKGDDGKWTPAAGTFDGWPKTAAEIRALDPCMGSGHFVVAMFERLVALRVIEDNLDETAAIAAVIRDNLFGLEIDPRCTQIGAFNLALAAWRRVGHCKLPAMNLACSGLAPNTRESDWIAMANGNETLKNGMVRLYRLFKHAPVLGSLINPRGDEGDLLVAAFHELEPLLEKALRWEAGDEGMHEMAVKARGLAKAAEMLAGRFTLVATNVPYLGRGKQHEILQDYCERIYPDAKADLATAFVQRCLEFCVKSGSTTLVTPQNWLFLGTYKKMRERLFREATWNVVAKLGPAAFQDMNWWAANTVVFAVTNEVPKADDGIAGLDVSLPHDPKEKAALITSAEVSAVSQSAQLKNPDARLLLTLLESHPLLEKYATSLQGISPADYAHYGRFFWEITSFAEWRWWQSTIVETIPFGGRELVLWWNSDLDAAVKDGAAFVRGEAAWGRSGVVVRQMRHLPCCIYTGEAFDTNCAVILPHNPEHLPAVWTFCSSPEFAQTVRQIDQKTNVTNSTLVKVPFDLEHWQTVASEKYPDGLPTPLSTDPTQWLFNGHPSSADNPLQVSVARMLGYAWPRQVGSSFPNSPALGADGLEALADDDGIVPVSPGKGEGPAAERLREVLARAFHEEWNASQQELLLAHVGCTGTSIEDWLRNEFFEQHCALFQNRPFIWHVWDGVKDGFQALVNYHRLCADHGGGRRTLEKLTFTYLGDWIALQRADQKAGKEGSDGKLAAALHLQEQLKLILEGEPPFDVFVRWKPLREQAIGWQPDINDGVRMNIRPFMNATTYNDKSIFRKAPKIKWDKDRGNEPERAKNEFPWFWSRDNETLDFMGSRTFDGKRWNDLHYSNAVKRAARDAAKGKKR